MFHEQGNALHLLDFSDIYKALVRNTEQDCVFVMKTL